MGWSARITVTMVALTIGTATVVGGYAYFQLESAALPTELARLDRHVHDLGEEIDGYVDGIRVDVLGLLNSPYLDAYVRARQADGVDPLTGVDAATWRERISATFVATLEADDSLDQLRLIDAADTGMELIRVDRSGDNGSVVVVPDAVLQAKGHRDYFGATIGRDPGDVYVSAIDLNLENGAVDPRRIPVLRVAVPVHDARGVTFGLLIVNVDMRPVLERLRGAVAPGGALYVLDQSDTFLVHPQRDREFVAGAAASKDAGWMRPLFAGAPSGARVLDVAGERTGAAGVVVKPAGGPPVRLLESLPYEVLIGPVTTLGRSTLVAAAFAALVAVVLAIIFSRTLIWPLSQMTRAVASAAGEGTVPAPVGAAGEVGVLARAFESMRDEVRAKRDALSQEVAERRLAEERFRLAVEACPGGMLIVDAGGVIELANRQACRMFGWEADALLGRNVEVLVPERFREAHPALRGGYLAAPTTRLMGEGRDLFGLRRGGGEFAVEIALNPIRTGSGAKVLAVVADITERKAAEHTLQQRTEHLERSNSELEQFAYVASHDLQEPLRIVASYTELLGERYRGQLDERADKYIHYAVDGARRMQRLVNDLLQFSRVGTQGGALVPTDSERVLAEVLESMHDVLDESKGRVCRSELPEVLADEMQLARVFQNLLSNAVKFRSADAPVVQVKCERLGGFWQFSVADNGIGIDMAHSDRVFQMFQRLHGRGEYEGSGIGLPIVRKIVERHGGRIWFESEPNKGSTFYFTLPTSEEAA